MMGTINEVRQQRRDRHQMMNGRVYVKDEMIALYETMSTSLPSHPPLLPFPSLPLTPSLSFSPFLSQPPVSEQK